ncbi:MAG: glycoside hydrolase family 2 protein [Bacteroidales bacterium]|nr:glycoside hydrolase family 2 protein [Bacteroidales bacterium]
MKYIISLIVSLLFSLSIASQSLEWPPVSSETKPWSRWWWPGSIVSREDLSKVMEQYSEAGLGGLELTVLYGVKGYESKFIPYLSPEWMKMFEHTLKEANRLNMGIDLANASSWPFGGPWVTDNDASRYVAFKTFTLREGETLDEKIEYIQEPSVRWNSPYRIDIKEIKDPVCLNPNLQQLAIDQIRFEKPIPVQTLMAYSNDGKIIELTDKIDKEGKLLWRAPAGTWTLYAVFSGWHGKMVERAGPGGEGYVIDHFSGDAIRNYLERFDKAFAGYDLSHLRGFFNDSYEVDDARGQADWTLNLFDEFQKRRGYNLKEHLPALFQKDNPEKNSMVLCDYRQTISDLLLDNFTRGWTSWAHEKGKLTRNQAHGSPGNILDLYAATDIPETEGTEIFRSRFATSAANVTGKRVVSAEAATWLDEHFSSTLADIKKAADMFFVAGVNHIVYHGTCFSPPDDPWPGFQFYAAAELNPANPIWADFHALNSYITRVQSFMQTGKPGNDVLLYFPASDTYSAYNRLMLDHFDGTGQRFRDTFFRKAAEEMNSMGYTFDFISDLQLMQCRVNGENIVTEGGTEYKVVVVPECRYIPVETFNKLCNLAEKGAIIIFYGNLPSDVSGFGDFEIKKEILNHLKNQLKFEEAGEGLRRAITGSGKVLQGNTIEKLLSLSGISRETLVDSGLEFCRRRGSDGSIYFIRNPSDKIFKGRILLCSASRSAALFNPMTGEKGRAPGMRMKDGKTELYLEFKPGESFIVRTYSKVVSGPEYYFYEPAGQSQALSGNWQLEFKEGGPVLPASCSLEEPVLWTTLQGEGYQDFSGSAFYKTTFSKPVKRAKYYSLNLGKVNESARIVLNGEYVATLTGPDFTVVIPAEKLKKFNTLEVRVTNLAANRIAYMDRKGIEWKKFYNTNFPPRLPQNRKDGLFDASAWPARPSGMKGPVSLTPVRQIRVSGK